MVSLQARQCLYGFFILAVHVSILLPLYTYSSLSIYAYHVHSCTSPILPFPSQQCPHTRMPYPMHISSDNEFISAAIDHRYTCDDISCVSDEDILVSYDINRSDTCINMQNNVNIDVDTDENKDVSTNTDIEENKEVGIDVSKDVSMAVDCTAIDTSLFDLPIDSLTCLSTSTDLEEISYMNDHNDSKNDSKRKRLTDVHVDIDSLSDDVVVMNECTIDDVRMIDHTDDDGNDDVRNNDIDNDSNIDITNHITITDIDITNDIDTNHITNIDNDNDITTITDINDTNDIDILHAVLRQVFNIRTFRPNQEDIIRTILSGQDVFVLMPTGGGKSLCYFLPALLSTGITIVVSPLLSLIEDQMQQLLAIGIPSLSMNGSMGMRERQRTIRILLDGIRIRDHNNYNDCVNYTNSNSNSNTTIINNYISNNNSNTAIKRVKILFVTPETLVQSQALHVLKDHVCRVVIDEAHCVSAWGNDFRPDYKKLSMVKRVYGCGVVALTATATARVEADIKRVLFTCDDCNNNNSNDNDKYSNDNNNKYNNKYTNNINNTNISNEVVTFRSSFDRKNLRYVVVRKDKETIRSIISFINTHYPTSSGIVYVISKREAEEVCHKLNAYVRSAYYHAGLSRHERCAIQREWTCGNVRIIVATVAFGMGINKADVRFVIHHTMPCSLENYYQETGRAGRDGLTSTCMLYYAYADRHRLWHMLRRECERERVRQVIEYCESAECRRSVLLRHFGERIRTCTGCDNCSSGASREMADHTTHARAVLALLRECADRMPFTTLVAVLHGSRSRAASAYAHLTHYGTLAHMHRVHVERLVRAMVRMRMLKEVHVRNKMGYMNSYLVSGDCTDCTVLIDTSL